MERAHRHQAIDIVVREIRSRGLLVQTCCDRWPIYGEPVIGLVVAIASISAHPIFQGVIGLVEVNIGSQYRKLKGGVQINVLTSSERTTLSVGAKLARLTFPKPAAKTRPSHKIIRL